MPALYQVCALIDKLRPELQQHIISAGILATR